jgi:hypothetical protein
VIEQRGAPSLVERYWGDYVEVRLPVLSEDRVGAV